jgi:hypothetical protein
MKKPIRVFYSDFSGRFYATRHYRQDSKCVDVMIVTGEKFDVTDDIGAIVTTYKIEFTERRKKKP